MHGCARPRRAAPLTVRRCRPASLSLDGVCACVCVCAQTLFFQIELAHTLDERLGAFLAADGMPAEGGAPAGGAATSRSERLAALLAAEVPS